MLLEVNRSVSSAQKTSYLASPGSHEGQKCFSLCRFRPFGLNIKLKLWTTSKNNSSSEEILSHKHQLEHRGPCVSCLLALFVRMTKA